MTDIETKTAAAIGPTFGQTIRALRLGWSYAYRRQCWVRITDAPGGFDVDLHPPGLVPSQARKVSHRCLRGHNVDDLLDMDVRLKAIARIWKPATIFVADGS